MSVHRRRWLSSLISILVAGLLSSTAVAQQIYDEDVDPRAPAIGRILELRKQLGLRDDQVQKLKAIRKQLKEQNAPLNQQIHQAIGEPPSAETLRKMSDAERKAYREKRKAQWAQHPELRPLQEQRRAHVGAAFEQAMAVLDADQRAMVEKRLQEVKSARQSKQGGGGNRSGQGGNTAP
jgi:chromosome segregation ATPase